jgi:hypothetical protein
MARPNNLPPRWVEIARKHRRRVPEGSPFEAYQEAMQAASAEYHGLPVRDNPGGGLLRTALIIGAVYLGYRALKGQQPAQHQQA